MNEFLCQLKEPMNARRSNMVKRCFKVMDRDGSGVITAADVKNLYNCSESVEVKAGKITEEECLEGFLNGFDGTEGDNDGEVSKEEWEA